MLPEKEFPVQGQAPQGPEKNILPPIKPEEEITPSGIPLLENDDAVNQEGVVVSDEDSNASSTNIFSDPAVAAHYVSVYEKAHYECRHVFDPKLDWTKKEEKTVVRKLDWHGKTSKKVIF
jgi:hypothetical protein